jgi:hypothetical protein
MEVDKDYINSVTDLSNSVTDLLKAIERLSFEIEVNEKAASKFGGDFFRAHFQKKVEDGIIEAIVKGKANDQQLSVILNKSNRFFQYYSEIYDLIRDGADFVDIGAESVEIDMTDPRI